MKIYETPNPFFLSDIFVFAEVEEIGLCYIKVNCFNRIEEIGFDIQHVCGVVVTCNNMIEIIKEGKYKKKIATCQFCGCEFTFDKRDVQSRSDGEFPFTRIEKTLLYVLCPCCNAEIR